MTINLNVDKETLDVIDGVLRKLASKHTFDSYEADDMYQEGFIIACHALKAYDPSKGTKLSTFLYTHLSKRLKNFIRDHSVRIKNHCIHHTEYVASCPNCKRRQATQDKKKGIQRPKGIDGMDFSKHSEGMEEIELREIEKRINMALPKDMREDYLRMKAGDYVTRQRKLEIENKILELVNV